MNGLEYKTALEARGIACTELSPYGIFSCNIDGVEYLYRPIDAILFGTWWNCTRCYNELLLDITKA